MRIIGHGIDMVEIARIKGLLDSPHKNWEEGAYSADEREQADQPPQRVRYYAGRFAGKEAVAKATRDRVFRRGDVARNRDPSYDERRS